MVVALDQCSPVVEAELVAVLVVLVVHWGQETKHSLEELVEE